MRSLDNWAPRTGVSALISRADLLLESSQIISWGGEQSCVSWRGLKEHARRCCWRACLISCKFGLSSSAHQAEVVSLAHHLHQAYTCVEVYWMLKLAVAEHDRPVVVEGLLNLPRTIRLAHVAVLKTATLLVSC